jgi:hypothetical protein
MGNESNCFHDTIIHDDVLPSFPTGLTLISPSQSPSNDPTPEIEVSGVNPQDRISLHTDPTCSVVSQKASGQAEDTTIRLTSSSLSEGNHLFYAQVVDLAGNRVCSLESLSYAVHTTVPVSLVVSSPSEQDYINQQNKSLSINGSCSHNGTSNIEIRINGVTFKTTSCVSGSFAETIDLEGQALSEGPFTLSVVCG